MMTDIAKTVQYNVIQFRGALQFSQPLLAEHPSVQYIWQESADVIYVQYIYDLTGLQST